MSRQILAALATIPERAEHLATVLRSLRPQVDRLAVVCNGFREIPPIVDELADYAWIEPENRLGDVAKLRWAPTWRGLYLACDDDLEYPADYAATMRREVERWEGRALVSIAGRRFGSYPSRWLDAQRAWRWEHALDEGEWANYAVTATLAFDALRLWLPRELGGIDGDAFVAEWAQAAGIPVWIAPHPAGWLRYLLPKDAPTIWQRHKAEDFASRDAFVKRLSPWRLTSLEEARCA